MASLRVAQQTQSCGLLCQPVCLGTWPICWFILPAHLVLPLGLHAGCTLAWPLVTKALQMRAGRAESPLGTHGTRSIATQLRPQTHLPLSGGPSKWPPGPAQLPGNSPAAKGGSIRGPCESRCHFLLGTCKRDKGSTHSPDSDRQRGVHLCLGPG